ncbi:hypothetical protein WICPIJ_004966 [Wickerhamomyces pijperi]|uniref:Uncharacterized protein n=1 Tax=Wickerhamomyces pijperi TaxID=599730 RepID=A0A9P8TME3_WICPI|nr:hypothetical protein WICPIJ_004966 [Wickerhamomyces pijperi]
MGEARVSKVKGPILIGLNLWEVSDIIWRQPELDVTCSITGFVGDPLIFSDSWKNNVSQCGQELIHWSALQCHSGTHLEPCTDSPVDDVGLGEDWLWLDTGDLLDLHQRVQSMVGVVLGGFNITVDMYGFDLWDVGCGVWFDVERLCF